MLALLAATAFAAAQTAPGNAGAAAGVFKENCSMCHGDDGTGSPFGARLNVKSLSSKEIQDKPSADLAKIIKDGKNNMPGFASKLNDDQVQELIDYIRHQLAKPH